MAEQQTEAQRNHPEYDEKTQQQLVDSEKKKIQKIHTLVNEVQEGTKALDAKIAVARESSDLGERKELISDISTVADQVKDKVLTAAKLEKDVAEINTVLKEKKKAEEREGGDLEETVQTKVANRDQAAITKQNSVIQQATNTTTTGPALS